MNKRRNSAYDKQIGNRLRQLRIERGLSQTSLGNALGITFQQVQKYETGKNAIASSRVPTLCKALGVNPDELYRIDIQTEAMGTIKVSALKVAQRLEKLSTNQRGVVNALIDAFEKENGHGRAA